MIGGSQSCLGCSIRKSGGVQIGVKSTVGTKTPGDRWRGILVDLCLSPQFGLGESKLLNHLTKYLTSFLEFQGRKYF